LQKQFAIQLIAANAYQISPDSQFLYYFARAAMMASDTLRGASL
jgi:hypothetical protein